MRHGTTRQLQLFSWTVVLTPSLILGGQGYDLPLFLLIFLLKSPHSVLEIFEEVFILQIIFSLEWTLNSHNSSLFNPFSAELRKLITWREETVNQLNWFETN
jgi:hypothetical protein